MQAQEFTHDPIQYVQQLQQLLSAGKLRVGFFLGAGCPTSIKSGGVPLIPSIKGLTDSVASNLRKSADHAASFNLLMQVFSEDGLPEPNIEQILSKVRALKEVSGKSSVRGLSHIQLDALDKEICEQILNTTAKDLPAAKNTPYHSLAEYIKTHSQPYTEVFTTNYDLLMEQALEALQTPFFDGFVGSSQPFFDQRAIEDDLIPERWARVWKLHGSVNWRINKNDKTIFRANRRSSTDVELLIHPSHLKYDDSRRMPYYVMMDRLRQFMRNSLEPVALIILGYSFSDDHVNETVVESLNANPRAAAFALQFASLNTYPAAINLATETKNLWVLGRDSAVTRGETGRWAAQSSANLAEIHTAFSPINFPKQDLEEETEKPVTCEFELGDFEKFGSFLLSSFGNRGQ